MQTAPEDTSWYGTQKRLYLTKTSGKSRVLKGLCRCERPFSLRLEITILMSVKPQPKYANGSFFYTDPRHCTVHDPKHSTCFLDGFNKDGFYEGGPIVVSTNMLPNFSRLVMNSSNLTTSKVFAVCPARYCKAHRTAGWQRCICQKA